jgi:hypothetical protein
MKMNLCRLPLLINAAILFLLVGCSAPSQVSRSGDFKERISSIKTISLEKPEVEILHGRPGSNAVRNPEEEAAASASLIAYFTSELQARGIKAKPPSGTSNRNPADGKMKIKMTMFKRSGMDNATEMVGKTVIGLMTAGMIVPFKDASGAVVLEATLYDMRDHHVLWANTGSDSSFRPVGEADFDLQKLVAKLFEEFD